MTNRQLKELQSIIGELDRFYNTEDLSDDDNLDLRDVLITLCNIESRNLQ